MVNGSKPVSPIADCVTGSIGVVHSPLTIHHSRLSEVTGHESLGLFSGSFSSDFASRRPVTNVSKCPNFARLVLR